MRVLVHDLFQWRGHLHSFLQKLDRVAPMITDPPPNNTTTFQSKPQCVKGHPPSADLRYVEEDGISPSTIVHASVKG